MKQTVIIAILSLFFSFNSPSQMKEVFAQTQESGSEETVAIDVVHPGDLIDDAIAKYAANKDIIFGRVGANGQVYYSAKEVVSVDPSSPQWGKARVMAYEKALLKARSEFVVDMYGKVTDRELYDKFSDSSDNAEQFPDKAKPGKLLTLYNKFLAFTGAKLDQKLEEVGVDPQEFAAANSEERKSLYLEKTTKHILTKAIGRVVGLVPVETFEGNDGAGNHVIGVITLYSPKLRQIASDISRKRESGNLSLGQPISQLIPEDEASLSSEFGIRCLSDEHGKPVLVSFGQWSHNYQGANVRKRQRMREAALEAAFDMANAAIAVFLNGNLMYENETVVGEVIEEVLKKDQQGMISREDAVNIIDRLNRNMRLEAKADLSGISSFRKWVYTTPYNHEVMGVVRVWTLEMAQGANNIRTWRANTSENDKLSQSQKYQMNPGVTQGSSLMRLDDF